MAKKKVENNGWGEENEKSLELDSVIEALNWIEKYGTFHESVRMFRDALVALDSLHSKLSP